MDELFFELLQVAIGNRERLSRVPTEKEWWGLLDMAIKQALVGIACSGMERLPKEQWPGQDVVFQWMLATQEIEQHNALTTEVCQQLCKELEEDGFYTCVLKGQTNHFYYPEKLKNKRTYGDIDIWVKPKDKSNRHPIKTVIEYSEKKYSLEGLSLQHAVVAPIRDVPVEMHFSPSYLKDPVRNRRLQNLFKDIVECRCEKDIGNGVVLPALKTTRDVVFQMTHMFRHLTDEGVGLRQVLDYYMLLQKKYRDERLEIRKIYSSVLRTAPLKQGDNLEPMKTIERLGMKRFARALMYVLKVVFAMPEEYMLCEPSEKDGRFLLSEMLLAGNMGQFDNRLAEIKAKEGSIHYYISKAWRRIKRNFRFLTSYPREILFEPFTRVYHHLWTGLKLWKY